MKMLSKTSLLKKNRVLGRAVGRAVGALESLEGRQLFAAFLATDIPATTVDVGTTTTDITLGDKVASATVLGTVVQIQTSLGNVDVELFDRRTAGRSATPITAANFLQYVNGNAYDNTVYHRSVANFVVQGGGFAFDAETNGVVNGLPAINTLPQIQNEFNADRSNLRGTLAMAKLGGDPNSATSQYFFNLNNNSANLDNQNGGFTVFARVLDDAAVTTDGMAVVDALAAVPVFNAGGAFSELPLRNFNNANPINVSNLLVVNDVVVLNNRFSVSSSNTNLVTPTIVTDSAGNPTLRLSYAAGQSGQATITLTGVTATGEAATSSFNVTVGGVSIRPTNIALPTSVRTNTVQTATVTIGNNGTGASLATTVLLKLTGTSGGQPVDITLGTANVPAISAGNTVNASVDFTLPANLATGNYTVTATLDAGNTSGDGVTSDNVLTKEAAVQQTGRAIKVEVASVEVANNGTALDFTRVLQGQQSSRISVRVTNVGTDPVVLSSITLSSPFTLFDTSSNVRSSATNVRPIVLNLPQTLTVGTGPTNSARFTIDADTSVFGRTLGALVINTDDDDAPVYTVNLRQTVMRGIVLGNDGDAATPTATQLSFTDADGTAVTVAYRGTRQVLLGVLGDNLAVSGTTRLTLSGSNVELISADVSLATGGADVSDARGTLAITAGRGGNGFTTIEQIDVRHTFRSLTGKGLVVTDAIRTAARIDTINVGTLDTAEVALEASSDPKARVALTFGSIVDSAISSLLPVKSLTVGSYSDTGARQTIAAVAIDSIKINGGAGFGSNLNVTSVPVKTASFKLPITGGSWTLSQGVGTLTTGAVSDGTSFTFGQPVRTFNVTGDFAGDIDGPAVSSLSVRGNINAADIDVTGAITKLSATGAVLNSRVEAGTLIKTFSAASLSGSNIYAGVTNPPTSGLPSPLAFGTTSEIGSLSLRARTDAFVNSSVAARTIKSLALSSVRVDNANVPFGIGADTISSARFTPTGQKAVSLRNITTQAQLTTLLSTQQVTLDDLQFSIA
jgi:cyclophilin family peptidyl-prolyl cis-trans isomerase